MRQDRGTEVNISGGLNNNQRNWRMDVVMVTNDDDEFGVVVMLGKQL